MAAASKRARCAHRGARDGNQAVMAWHMHRLAYALVAAHSGVEEKAQRGVMNVMAKKA